LPRVASCRTSSEAPTARSNACRAARSVASAMGRDEACSASGSAARTLAAPLVAVCTAEVACSSIPRSSARDDCAAWCRRRVASFWARSTASSAAVTSARTSSCTLRSAAASAAAARDRSRASWMTAIPLEVSATTP
jgi:hypothetical protein